jgi:hypothetical protein
MGKRRRRLANLWKAASNARLKGAAGAAGAGVPSTSDKDELDSEDAQHVPITDATATTPCPSEICTDIIEYRDSESDCKTVNIWTRPTLTYRTSSLNGARDIQSILRNTTCATTFKSASGFVCRAKNAIARNPHASIRSRTTSVERHN